MTNAASTNPEPLDLLPLPEDVVVLSSSTQTGTPREMVLVALEERLKAQKLDWNIGPSLDLPNPERLLSMNQFAVQLLTSGFTADVINVPLSHWHRSGAAPQLLLAARVDEESQVVHIPGLLTGMEFQQWIRSQPAGQNLRPQDELEVPFSLFKGGIERLLTLVQLLKPEAINRKGIEPAASLQTSAASVLDWLSGQLDEALQALGGSLVPATAGSFRSSVGSPDNALAVLAIPLGLEDGQLRSGNAAQTCIERFRLLLMPTGSDQPEQLLLRLVPELEGDLLPDALTLKAHQGDWHQTKTSQMNTALELIFSVSEQVIEVAVSFPDSTEIVLPPLKLSQ